jgi:predicted transcriptional regulator YheO
MSTINVENELILREARKIVEALGKMFAPTCEVVLHDLTKPQHAIIAIECPLSGRKIGEPTTEMGLARIEDPNFPDVVQNYVNAFPDGRPAKSTSIGLKNSEGKFIAAICLNLDVSLFSTMSRVLEQLTTTEDTPVKESLRTRTADDLRKAIAQFAARHNTQPRALSQSLRRELVLWLDKNGLLQLHGAMSATAEILGIARASVYNILKS